MNEKVLIERIEKVFGKYQRPTSFPGEFVEYWQEHVVKIPLDELELKDICDAVCHIPIKTQGNLDVFRYVLRRALYLAFWKVYEYELSEQDFSRKEDYLKYLDKQEDMFLYGPFPKDDSPFYDDIRVRTAQRCIEWKSQLEEEERELLEDIFWWAFQEDYKNTKEISPFYFTLLLAWEKKIPDCHRLG